MVAIGVGGHNLIFRVAEGWRVTSRFRLALVAGSLALSGCGDFNAGTIRYSESERLAKELKDKTKLQAAVRKAVADLYGDTPQVIKVPKGTGIPGGGRRLGNRVQETEGAQKITKKLVVTRLDPATWTTEINPSTGKPVTADGEGGYRLYRRHCLHCHGVSGDGAGPTADFLYPRPRDYRLGLFKFTSTPNGAKPTRADLRKTVREGLHGTSMPAFDALMEPHEIEQVLDYVMFLSIRGETEQNLIEEAGLAQEKDPDPLPAARVLEIAEGIAEKWKLAEGQVLNPPVPRTLANPESVARGRDLFLGRTDEKLVCTTCHGLKAKGNGDQWIDETFLNDVVFYRKDPTELMRERVYGEGVNPESLDPATRDRKERELKTLQDLWAKSLDKWNHPLRPANLNKGVYKGGRRPIDIYWRVADGITGTPMPGHASVLKPDKLWDVVNFVLALPYEPHLLDVPPAAAAKPAAAVAQRSERKVSRP
jgi:mono/diheme cytochrome c family protein